MILAIDVGNTNMVMGCMEGDTIIFTARFRTDREKTEDDYTLMLMNMFQFNKVDPKTISGGIISSVVPTLRNVLYLAIRAVSGKKSLIVGPDLKIGLTLAMDNPSQVGSDLIVGAVAAIDRYPLPALIFDMGTATTLAVIDKDQIYVGGMIMPGLQLSMDALAAKTSQLPRISLDTPSHMIGKNTIDSMKAGAIYGSAAMIDGIIDRVEEELGEIGTILATGGMVHEVVRFCKRQIIVEENLMLHGLKILYDRNQEEEHRG